MIRLRHLLLLLLTLTISWTSWAQVTFTVDAPLLVSMSERVQVQFSVNKEPDSDSTFQAPTFEGFNIIAGPAISTGMNVQWINGHQTSSYNRTYTFVLKPQSAGKHTIAPASIVVDGKKYTTKSIAIEVIDESAAAHQQPQSEANNNIQKSSPSGANKQKKADSSISSEDIFIVLKTSKNEVYKGEALTATLMLYTRVGYPDIHGVDLPIFNDFWTQEIPSQSERSRAEYNGRVYDTYRLAEYIVAPQRTGELTITPAELDVVVQMVTHDNSPRSIFHGGRHVSLVNRKLRSAPTTVRVKEFPEGAPASFSGAVGEFSMSSIAPEATMSANSSNEITITITGSGNLKFITAPRISLPESFEIYDTKITDNLRTSTSGASGSITYSYPFVARAAGEYTISPIVFSYFDLDTKQYKSLSTESFTITVTDDGSIQSSSEERSAYRDYGGRMKQLDRDIRFIHTGDLSHRSASLFIFSPAYWLIMVAALSLFIVVYVVMRKRILQNRNIVARRMRQADKVAIQRLRMAQHSMELGEQHAFYSEMLRAMWGYIGDKFNIPQSSLTKETIREELYRRGVSAADAELFCEIISRADEAQYAPSAEGDMREVYDDALSVISKIESVVKR